MRNPFKRSPKPAQSNRTATQTEANFPAAPGGYHFEYGQSSGGEVFVELVHNGISRGTAANTRHYKGEALEARLAAAMQTLVDDHNKRITDSSIAEAAIKKAKAAQWAPSPPG